MKILKQHSTTSCIFNCMGKLCKKKLYGYSSIHVIDAWFYDFKYFVPLYHDSYLLLVICILYCCWRIGNLLGVIYNFLRHASGMLNLYHYHRIKLHASYLNVCTQLTLVICVIGWTQYNQWNPSVKIMGIPCGYLGIMFRQSVLPIMS